MISFPGVSSLENSEERSEPGSGSRRAAAAGLGAVPGALRPPRALPCPPSSRSGNPEMEVPGPAGRGWGASFRGRLQVPSTSPPAARRPSPHGAASALAAWGSPGLRACLPRGVGKPRERTRLVERRGQVESGLCVAARVGRGLFAAPL